MIKWFRDKFLGGESGAREAGTFVFLAWLSGAVVVSVAELRGVSMPDTAALIEATRWAAITAFVAPKIYMRHLLSKGEP